MPTTAKTRVSTVPSHLTNDKDWKRSVTVWAQEAAKGHLDNVGLVSLTSGTASTVITDTRIGAFSFIGFMPQTANAAAELGGGTLYVATQSKGAATITHANAATGDRTFCYCILG